MAMKNILRPAKLFSTALRGYSSGAKLVSVQMNEKTGIATVSMDRSPVNGLNYELLKDLCDTLDELDQNNARGAILTSSLKTIFSGGLDIMEMYKPNQDRLKAFWTQLQNTWMTLYNTPYPTVAAINGHSPAGGCLLAMCCEYRVMVNNYTIGLNETQLGIVAPFWFISTMRNTINIRDAELALTTGRLFSTQEALDVGLIDEVAADREECIAKAEAFFKRFAKVNPLARQLTKTALRDRDIDALRERQEQDLEQFIFSVNQPMVQKGLERYMEALKKKSAK